MTPRDITAPIALLRAGLDASWRRLLDCPGDDFTRTVETHRGARDVLDNAYDDAVELAQSRSAIESIRACIAATRDPSLDLPDEDAIAAPIGNDDLRETTVDVRALAVRLRAMMPQRAASLASQLAASERALATATRERDAARDESRARAVAIGALAAGRPVEWAALDGRLDGCAIDALRRIAARVDPQPAHGGASGGAGVDHGAVLSTYADRVVHAARSSVDPYGLALDVAADMRRAALDARPPQGSADERGQAVEREAEVVRVVIGEGALATCGERGPLYVGERIGVYGGRLDGLAEVEGQHVRLIVEVVAHPANVSPVAGGEKSE